MNGWLQPEMLSPDFLIQVAMGKVPGYSHINKFGNNIATTAGDDVWDGGGSYPFYPTAGVAVDIVSTSQADNGTTATGAIQVVIEGLGPNSEEQTEMVTLNGTGVVQLTKTYIRLFRAFVYEAGASNTNAGVITAYARATASGLTIGDVGIHISIGSGQTLQTPYSIPAGKTGYFIKGYVGLANSTFQGEDGTFRWLMKLNNGVNGAWLTQGQIGLVNIGNSQWQYEYGIPAGPLPEKTDIRIELTAASATMNTVGGFDILLVDN